MNHSGFAPSLLAIVLAASLGIPSVQAQVDPRQGYGAYRGQVIVDTSVLDQLGRDPYGRALGAAPNYGGAPPMPASRVAPVQATGLLPPPGPGELQKRQAEINAAVSRVSPTAQAPAEPAPPKAASKPAPKQAQAKPAKPPKQAAAKAPAPKPAEPKPAQPKPAAAKPEPKQPAKAPAMAATSAAAPPAPPPATPTSAAPRLAVTAPPAPSVPARTAAPAYQPAPAVAPPAVATPVVPPPAPPAAPPPATPSVAASAPTTPPLPPVPGASDTTATAAAPVAPEPTPPAPPPAPPAAAPSAPATPAASAPQMRVRVPPAPPPATTASAPSAPAMPPLSATTPSLPGRSATTLAAAPSPPPAPPPAGQSENAAAPATGPIAAGKAVARVQFPTGSSDLPEGAKSALKSMADRMNRDADMRVQLLAYAGPREDTASQARRLSLFRALAVRSYLIEQGIRSTRMDVRALGNKYEEEPADRVDVVIVDR